MGVQENYRDVLIRMQKACERSQRDIKDITLIGVTKYVEPDLILPALAQGLKCVGENRVQELLDKRDFFENNDCSIHLIGQLQTNKVKYIVGMVHLIQSVDRLSLAQEIERQAAKRNTVQDILLEVNIGEEPQKGGMLPAKLMELMEAIEPFDHVRIKGIMCVPPIADAATTRAYFQRMRDLFLVCQNRYPAIAHLSMGMSSDFEIAIEEGATMIRVGSALFGHRVYQ